MLRHRVLRRAALRVWVLLGKKTTKMIGARSLSIATSKKTARRAGAGRFLEAWFWSLTLGGIFLEAMPVHCQLVAAKIEKEDFYPQDFIVSRLKLRS